MFYIKILIIFVTIVNNLTNPVKKQCNDKDNTILSGLMAIEQKPMKQNQSIRQGRWTKEEHYRFLEALKLYGKEWKKVQEHVKTRTSTQARSHAQKFFQKLEKKKQNLQDFLDNLDVNNLDKHCIMSDLEDEEPSS